MDLGPVVEELLAAGASLRGVAAELNARAIPAPRGGRMERRSGEKDFGPVTPGKLSLGRTSPSAPRPAPHR